MFLSCEKCDVPTFQRNCCPTKPSLIEFSMHLPFLAGNTATKLHLRFKMISNYLRQNQHWTVFQLWASMFSLRVVYIYIILYIYCNTYKLMSSIPLKLLYFLKFYLHIFITLVDYLAAWARHPPSHCWGVFSELGPRVVNSPPIHDMLDWENGYSNHGIRGVSCFETTPKEPFLFPMFPWNLCSS